MDDSTRANTLPPPETRRLPKAWAAELLRRLAVIYGDRLSLTDPAAADEWIDTWSETLGWVTAEQIAVGLDAVERRVKRAAQEGRTEWPVSSVEFLALCQSRTLPAHRPLPRLGGPRVRSSVAEECLRKMREMLA